MKKLLLHLRGVFRQRQWNLRQTLLTTVDNALSAATWMRTQALTAALDRRIFGETGALELLIV